MLTPYQGNCPGSASKDAKYSVVGDGAGGYEIRLILRLNNSEKALLTSAKHAGLVERINAIKTADGSPPGGAFYINEYRCVLVPAGRTYYCAGKYTTDLEFEFEGRTIGPQAPSGLSPGDVWLGPHQGIPYALTSGCADVKYQRESRPNVTEEVRLSDLVEEVGAAETARTLGRHKGQAGGRIYINEAREFFTKIEQEFIYLGPLGSLPWFPEPDCES